LLGNKDAAQPPEENLKDSKGGDEKLTAIGEKPGDRRNVTP
jgi:hypothetical protein